MPSTITLSGFFAKKISAYTAPAPLSVFHPSWRILARAVRSGCSLSVLVPRCFQYFSLHVEQFQKGHTTYHIHRAITETKDIVENGVHEIYVNAAASDGSVNAELMQYFMNSNGYHPKFKKISQTVLHYKESYEGVTEMANVFDEYAEERTAEKLQEAAINMLEKNISVEDILDIIPSLTKETVLLLQEQLKMQAVV